MPSLHLSRLPSHARILELGCGAGSLSRLSVNPAGMGNIGGVDISKRQFGGRPKFGDLRECLLIVADIEVFQFESDVGRNCHD